MGHGLSQQQRHAWLNPQGRGTWGGCAQLPGDKGCLQKGRQAQQHHGASSEPPSSDAGDGATSPFAVSSWKSLPQMPSNPQHVSPAIRGSQTWRLMPFCPPQQSQGCASITLGSAQGPQPQDSP